MTTKTPLDPLRACLDLRLQSDQELLTPIRRTSQAIERSWEKKAKQTNAPRKKRVFESDDTATRGPRRMPFQDLSNLSQHAGMKSIRTTRSEAKDESLLLRRQLDSKDRELSALRQSLDAMRLQMDVQEDHLKTARRQEFKHRICSVSLLEVQVDTVVFVESYGFGRVVKSTFQYDTKNTYWSLVSGVTCFLDIKFEEIDGKSSPQLRVKLGTLERLDLDRKSSGHAIWAKTSTVTRAKLQDLYKPFTDEQRNAIVHCLLSESQGDSELCNTIIASYYEDQTAKKKKKIYNLERSLERVQARVEEAEKVELEPVEKQMSTKEVKEESKRLTDFSNWLDAFVDKRIRRVYSEFTAYGEPLLTTAMIDDDIVRVWRRDFPIVSEDMFNSICSPSHVLQKPKEKWRKAFLNFFMQHRQRNPGFGAQLAKVFGLALYKWGVSKTVHQVLSFLGLSCHPSQVQPFMQELSRIAPDPSEFLRDKPRLLSFADNYNEYLSTKHQDGNAGEMRNFCVVFIMLVLPLPPVPTFMMYPVEEGQPKLTFLDQKVPAPVFMLPYELIKEDSPTMEYLVKNMRSVARKGDEFKVLCQLLKLQPTRFRGYEQMKPTNGKRARAYYLLVRKMLSITRFAKHFESRLKKLPRPFGKRRTELIAMMERQEELLVSAKTCHQNMVRQWNPHADKTSKLFQSKLSQRDEGKSNDCGKLELDVLKLIGILESESDNRLKLAEDFASLLWMGGDQLTVERMIKFKERIQAKAVHFSRRKDLLDVLNNALKRVIKAIGSLHTIFGALDMIFRFGYGGMLQPFQTAFGFRRLGQDPTTAYQLGKHFLEVMHECLREALLTEYLATKVDIEESPLEFETGFSRFLESLCESDDEVRMTVGHLLRIIELFLDCVEAMRRGDRVLEETLHMDLWPYFLATGKSKYSNLVELEIENNYESMSSADLNLFRCNASIKLFDASKNVAFDEFNEMQVANNKQLPTLRLPEHEITRSQHLALMKEAQLMMEVLMGNLDKNHTKKTASTTINEVKLDRIKARGMELIELSGMVKYVPGRKIEELNLVDLVPELKTPLRDPQVDLWEDTDVDNHFAAAVGLGEIVTTLVDDDDDDGRGDGENGDGLNLDFLLRCSGKPVPLSKLMGKKDPKVEGLKKIVKRNPLEVRRRKKELDIANVAFADFIVANMGEAREEKVEAIAVRERVLSRVTPTTKRAFVIDASRYFQKL